MFPSHDRMALLLSHVKDFDYESAFAEQPTMDAFEAELMGIMQAAMTDFQEAQTPDFMGAAQETAMGILKVIGGALAASFAALGIYGGTMVADIGNYGKKQIMSDFGIDITK